MDLQGKRVLVTGGSFGIGLGIAQACLRAGARVVVASRRAWSDEVRTQLAGLGECRQVLGDMSDLGVPQRVVQEAAACWGGLDTLVNNAGTFADTDFYSMTEENFSRTFHLNVRGYFFAAQEFARQAGQRQYDASIINIGSTNSAVAEKNSVLYDSSKGAILMMTKSLALTLASQGLRVNAVGPGIILTPLTAPGFAARPELEPLLNHQIPMGRIGTIDDCGGAVVFLASDAAKYITGQMIWVDGGLLSQQMVWEWPK